jgi:hypothetical protein
MTRTCTGCYFVGFFTSVSAVLNKFVYFLFFDWSDEDVKEHQ